MATHKVEKLLFLYSQDGIPISLTGEFGVDVDLTLLQDFTLAGLDRKMERAASLEQKNKWILAREQYMRDTKDLVDEYLYTSANYIPTCNAFAGKQDPDELAKLEERQAAKLEQTLQLVQTMTEAAKGVVTIQLKSYVQPSGTQTTNITNDQECVTCGELLPEEIDINPQVICIQCGTENRRLTAQIRAVTTRGYDDRDNFIKGMFAYEGLLTLNNKFVDGVMRKLDAHFAKLNMPIGEEIRQLAPVPNDRYERRPGTTKEMMKAALTASGITNYDYINFLCHRYWGWKLPNLTDIRNKILITYDTTQLHLLAILKENPNLRRTTFPRQYRLLKILQIHNYPCDAGDFRLVKNDSLHGNEQLWYMVTQRAGLPFYRT